MAEALLSDELDGFSDAIGITRHRLDQWRQHVIEITLALRIALPDEVGAQRLDGLVITIASDDGKNPFLLLLSGSKTLGGL